MPRIPLVLCLLLGLAAVAGAQQRPATPPWERELLDLGEMPFLRRGVRAYQASSFDPLGTNDDGLTGINSFRYVVPGANGFPWFVVFDETGPAVLHRMHFAFLDTIVPGAMLDEYNLYFYFDDEVVPRLVVRAKDLVSGTVAPFLWPLAMDDVVSPGGPLVNYPIPFQKRLQVVADMAMHYFDWQFHRYPAGTPMESWSPQRARLYPEFSGIVGALPADPLPTTSSETGHRAHASLLPAASSTLFDLRRGAMLRTLELRFSSPLGRDELQGLRLQVRFDGASMPQVDAPVGLFFGDDLEENPRSGLLIGFDPARGYYSHFPMPFARSCELVLRNGTGNAIDVDARLRCTPLPRGRDWAHFHATYREQSPTQMFEEYVVLETRGHGHFVGTTMTMGSDGYLGNRQLLTYLEGDERIHVDGSATPQLHGTGTEEFFNWGWYEMPGITTFALHEHGHPSRFVEGIRDYSTMYRTMHADYVPFYSDIRVAFEVGPVGEVPANYRSVAYWYGRPDPVLFSTDVLDVGNPVSEAAHAFLAPNGSRALPSSTFAYEGGWDPRVIVTDEGVETDIGQPTRFRLAVDPENRGVLLRRRTSIRNFFQAAEVLVDGVSVGDWRFIRVNPYRGWIDTDLELSKAVTQGKAFVEIEIRPKADFWNAFRYEAFSYR